MASGLRSSQQHTLSHQLGLMVFTGDDSSVSLAPVPGFLVKNEREGLDLSPSSFQLGRLKVLLILCVLRLLCFSF